MSSQTHFEKIQEMLSNSKANQTSGVGDYEDLLFEYWILAFGLTMSFVVFVAEIVVGRLFKECTRKIEK